MAEPSRKNSGFETTSKSAVGFASAISFVTVRTVPTGTVDFVTMTVYPLRLTATSFATACTYCISARPVSGSEGVPTAMKTTSAFFTA